MKRADTIVADKRSPVRWLCYLISALTFFVVMRSIGSLLKQVQQSGSDVFGGMESLGSGLLPVSAVRRTLSLLEVWHDAGMENPDVKWTVLWTAGVYTVADVLFIICYTLLLTSVFRWLAARVAAASEPRHAEDSRWGPLLKLAKSKHAVWVVLAAALVDLAEDGIRFGLVSRAFAAGDDAVPAWVIGVAWGLTSTKFLLLGLSSAVLLLLVRESGILAGRWGTIRWSLWRLRVPIGATVVFVALVLGDPTGQADDLIRRWLDGWSEAGIGLSAAIGAGLLGFTVWLITRRIVLSDQRVAAGGRPVRAVVTTVVWAVLVGAAGAAAMYFLDWRMDWNTAAILTVGFVLVVAAAVLPSLPITGPVAAVATNWRTILLVASAAAWIIAGKAHWAELRAWVVVAGVILLLELLTFLGEAGFRGSKAALKERCRLRDECVHRERSRRDSVPEPAEPDSATPVSPDGLRESDVKQPAAEKAWTTQLIARLVAVAAPVTLLIAAAGAIAPVPLVLFLSDRSKNQAGYLVVVVLLVAAPAIVAIAGYTALRKRDHTMPDGGPDPLEKIYGVFVVVIAAGAVFGMIGGAAHWSWIGPLSIVAAFLAATIIVLGEAQLWSDTHRAPPSFLLVGVSRVPPVALLMLVSLIAGFGFSDGTGHEVHKSGPWPASTAFGPNRAGIDLDAAFRSWAAANCADEENRGSSVPLILVSAPGGGLRAAYWTASSLSDLFGATAADATSCPGAAPSNRVFAVGGASGGSLGEVAWLGGLLSGGRSRDWYERQLARPDFLTDPLAWLLTVDLARSLLGFHGEDRAHRLELRWEESMPPLADDFFTGSWGAGGRLPVPLLTGTQVETGCRISLSGLRVTRAETSGGRETSCTTVHEGIGQNDAPATSDLLDYLCGPERGSDQQSINRSAAALMSARFPWVSPSGQLDRCAAAVDGESTRAMRISVVDGGYADNTGMGLLLDIWPRLETLIAEHNAKGTSAMIVPIFLEVDNHYASVAAPGTPDRTAETLVPPLTKDRPDQLDDLTMRARIESAFAGPVPGTASICPVDADAGRYVRVSPEISPGLPAPLAWTLSEIATRDLRIQRLTSLRDEGPARLKTWAAGIPAGTCVPPAPPG